MSYVSCCVFMYCISVGVGSMWVWVWVMYVGMFLRIDIRVIVCICTDSYATGDVFEGTFKQDRFCGHGVLTTAQGVKYRGICTINAHDYIF